MTAPTDQHANERPPDAGASGALSRLPWWGWMIAAVIVLVVAAVAIVATRPDEPTAGTPPTVVTTAAPAVTPAPAPTPTPTQAPTTAAPVPASVQLRADGLGVARFGDEMDATIAGLTAVLGAPSDPGAITTEGCTGLPHRTTLWGDLAVGFNQSQGRDQLTFEGYQYGWTNVLNGQAPPVAARPVLMTPGGLGITGTPQSMGDLLAQTRQTFPTAHEDESGNPDFGSISAMENQVKINVSLARAEGGWLVRSMETLRMLDGQAC